MIGRDGRVIGRRTMFGWRNETPTPYYGATSLAAVVVSPTVVNPFSYIVDTLGDFITDTSGNRLIVND